VHSHPHIPNLTFHFCQSSVYPTPYSCRACLHVPTQSPTRPPSAPLPPWQPPPPLGCVPCVFYKACRHVCDATRARFACAAPLCACIRTTMPAHHVSRIQAGTGGRVRSPPPLKMDRCVPFLRKLLACLSHYYGITIVLLLDAQRLNGTNTACSTPIICRRFVLPERL
jgi:hypothetical protein